MNIIRSLTALACFLILTPQSLYAAAGNVDTFWNLNIQPAGSAVHATAVQADGKVIIAGSFSSVLGSTRNNIARINANGTLDTSFNPRPNGPVYAVAVQFDGRIIFGGAFSTVVGTSTTSRANLARYNENGTLDTTFTTGTDNWVYALAIDASQNILVGGDFTTIGGTARNRIARLFSGGSLNSGFNPNANGTVRTIALQSDGKILLGGSFTTLQPNGAATATARNHIARVESSGALDTAFDPNANNTVVALAAQPDGKVLIGGRFTTLQPNGAATATTRNRIARVEPTGALDTGFNPDASDDVNTLALQADGRIILGGRFLTVSSTTRKSIARVNPTGALDVDFDPEVNGEIYSLGLLGNGRILLGGPFTNVPSGSTTGGITWGISAMMFNDGITSSLTLPDNSQIIWNRGGAAPDLTDVVFEYTPSPGNWLRVSGTYSRVGTTADWQVTGASLPASSTIRARGRIQHGIGGASSGVVQLQQPYSGIAVPKLVVSGNNQVIARNDTTPSSLDHTAFGSVFTATTDSISRTFTIQNTGTNTLTVGSVSAQFFSFNGTFPSGSGYDGAFTVTTQPASPLAPGETTTFTIRFDPIGNTQIGTLDYSVFANSNDPDGPLSFRISGTGLNSLPFVNIPIPDQSVNVGSAYTYQIPSNTFRDPDDMFDGHSPTYSTSGRPAWLAFNASTRTFSGTPALANAGSYDITVTYNDGKGASVSDTFTLTVVAPNSAPTVANPIPDQTATQDLAFSYTFPENTFADIDAGTVLTYTTGTLPAWLSFNASTRTFSGTPGNSDVGFVDITVTATDNGEPPLSASDTFRVTVTAAPPELTDLERWREQYFDTIENAGDAADDADFDKDGVPNLVEFAFGMNPTVPDNELLPQPVLENGSLSFSYTIPPGVTGITHGAQWSTTLGAGDWHDIPNSGTAESPVFSTPTAGRDRLFIRHLITSP